MHSPQVSEAQAKAISQVLKLARERRGDTLTETALKIALSSAQLRAIEAADFRPFYSQVYFLQAAQRYADFLGVTLPGPTQEAATADAVNKEHSSPEAPENLPINEPLPAQKREIRWGWIAMVISTLIALGILKISLDQSAQHASPATETTNTPGPTPSDTAQPKDPEKSLPTSESSAAPNQAKN